MTEKYQPSNGTEGDWFMARFCHHCHHESFDNDIDNHCDIIALTMLLKVTDDDYPKEWIRDENGPRCTAFSDNNKKLDPPRCTKTLDMFDKD